MFLGIKLSNLTRDKKILMVKKIFLPNFAEYLSSSTRQKKICRVPGSRHSAKYPLCRVPGGGTRQRLDAISPPQRASHGGRACWARAPDLPSAARPALGKGDSLPSAIRCRQPALGKARACRVADVCRVLVSWHSAKHIFAECPCSGTRQRPRHSVN